MHSSYVDYRKLKVQSGSDFREMKSNFFLKSTKFFISSIEILCSYRVVE